MPFLKSATSNLSNCKIMGSNKKPKFRTKRALFGYFGARTLKNLSYLKSAPSNLSNYKISRFRKKNALLRYFSTIILKNYCHIWNQSLQICLISKFREEIKMHKFGTKNAIFGYLWPKMHDSTISGQELHEKKKTPKFRLEFEHNIVIFEINTLEFASL